MIKILVKATKYRFSIQKGMNINDSFSSKIHTSENVLGKLDVRTWWRLANVRIDSNNITETIRDEYCLLRTSNVIIIIGNGDDNQNLQFLDVPLNKTAPWIPEISKQTINR